MKLKQTIVTIAIGAIVANSIASASRGEPATVAADRRRE